MLPEELVEEGTVAAAVVQQRVVGQEMLLR